MSVTYRVTHRTEYEYESDVSSSYGQLHLLPRELPGQRCRSTEVTHASREPEYFRERVDYFGNRVAFAAIHEPHRALTVTADSVVEVDDRPSGLSLLGRAPVGAGARRGAAARRRGDRARRRRSSRSTRRSCSGAACIADYARRRSRPAGRCSTRSPSCPRASTPTSPTSPGATSVNTPLAEVFAQAQGRLPGLRPPRRSPACARSACRPATSAATWRPTRRPGARSSRAPTARTPGCRCSFPTPAGWTSTRPTTSSSTSRYIVTAYGRDYCDVPPLNGVIYTEGKTTQPEGRRSTSSRSTPERPRLRKPRAGVRYTPLMRSFACDNCGQLVFFENSLCLRCSTPLAVRARRGWTWSRSTAIRRRGPAPCANSGIAECNWAVEERRAPGRCAAPAC